MKSAHPAVAALLSLAAAAACDATASRAANEDHSFLPDASPRPDASADAALEASSDAGNEPVALQMHDVSILFPLPASGGTHLLSPSDAGAYGALIPAATFDLAGFTPPPPAPGAPSTPSYASLHVVAARIDPCFGVLAPTLHDTTCENQLRLVFQSVASDASGGDIADDSGIHAFYRLSRAQAIALTREVVAVRRANETSSEAAEMSALGVHPQMARQGLSGTAATGIRTAILKYAGASSLARLTRFTNSGVTWTFDGVDVSATGTTTPMNIPGVHAASGAEPVTSAAFFIGFAPSKIDGTLPESTVEPNFVLLAQDGALRSATTSAKQAALDAALRIQNPSRHSPNTVDCASCHAAFGLQKRVAETLLGIASAGNANAFVPPASIASSQMSLAADGLAASATFNVHMFGYEGSTPTVNARVVNETAGVVDFMTKALAAL